VFQLLHAYLITDIATTNRRDQENFTTNTKAIKMNNALTGISTPKNHKNHKKASKQKFLALKNQHLKKLIDIYAADRKKPITSTKIQKFNDQVKS
jgi:hypothetical protein